MRAEIITIGDEILIGQITDTNSKWIAERLNEIGVEVVKITSIHDDRSQITDNLTRAEEESELVLLTGGLGPTKDDITKRTLVTYFEDELTFYPDVAYHIKGLFAKIKYPYTDKDLEQASLPKEADILKNHLGTASGMWFERKGTIVVSMPGVPNEMKGLMSDHVIPRLRKRFHLPYIIHQTIQTYGLGESRLAHRLESWEEALPDFIKLAYLPSYGRVRLRLSARGPERDPLDRGLEEEVKKLKSLIPELIVGYNDKESLELSINKLMTEEGLTLGVAESCTGGRISHLLTAVPGASVFLKGALITYSETSKISLLGVRKESLENFSVVSSEVAVEMALGCQKALNTDYAISTTGNAGPTRDKTDKEVGTVIIAITGPKGTQAQEFYFGRPREKVIERASVKALEILRTEILKNRENSLSD